MKKIGSLLLAGMLCFTMAGCSKGNELGDDIKKLEQDAVTEAKDVEKVTEEKIHEAVDYINKNIATPAEEMSEDVVKKVSYYATYLEEAGKNGLNTAEHDISKFGKQSHEYIKKVSESFGEKLSEAEVAVQEEAKKLGDTINKDKDAIVSEFHKLFK